MTMRHKPILPKQYEAPKRKRRNEARVPLPQEQQDALTQWQKDFQNALPSIQQAAGLAQRIFQEVIDAPTWQIVDGRQPEDFSPPEPWTVGHAKVNHVDHIEIKGDSA